MHETKMQDASERGTIYVRVVLIEPCFFAKLRNLRTILSDVAPTKMSLQNFILIGNKISQTPQPSQTCLKSPRGYKFCSIYTVW